MAQEEQFFLNKQWQLDFDSEFCPFPNDPDCFLSGKEVVPARDDISQENEDVFGQKNPYFVLETDEIQSSFEKDVRPDCHDTTKATKATLEPEILLDGCFSQNESPKVGQNWEKVVQNSSFCDNIEIWQKSRLQAKSLFIFDVMYSTIKYQFQVFSYSSDKTTNFVRVSLIDSVSKITMKTDTKGNPSLITDSKPKAFIRAKDGRSMVAEIQLKVGSFSYRCTGKKYRLKFEIVNLRGDILGVFESGEFKIYARKPNKPTRKRSSGQQEPVQKIRRTQSASSPLDTFREKLSELMAMTENTKLPNSLLLEVRDVIKPLKH